MDETDDRGTPRDYEALINALDARRIELGLSHADLDRIAGVAAGYSGKAFGPSRIKKIGWLSTFDYLAVLGLEIRLVANDAAAAAYAERALKRNGNQARVGNNSAPVSKRVVDRVWRHVAKTYSWSEILKAASTARKAAAAEEAARAARKAKSAAAKEQKPAKRPAVAAYDGGMVTAIEGLADSVGIYI